MEQEYYKSGDLARVFNITLDTVRMYDKFDILTPDYVDDLTGYRFYSTKQVAKLKFILYLKEMNFSLKEIKKLFQGEMLIDSKKQQLLKKINSMKQFLLMYSKFNKNENSKPEIKTFPAHYVVSETKKMNNWQDIVPAFDNLSNLIIKNKLKQVVLSNPFAIFVDKKFLLNKFTCKVCLEVENSNNPAVEKLEKQKYLTCIHRGSYETLQKTYEYLFKYAKQHKITIKGFPLEKYLVGYSNKPLSKTYITEVCLPIQ